MLRHAAEETQRRQSDPLSRYLSSLGHKRFQRLIEESGLPSRKIEEWRDDVAKPIKYVEALRLSRAAGLGISLEDILKRHVPDRDRYDTPLGRKVAACLLGGAVLSEILSANSISRVEFNRWLTENVNWHRSTKAKIKKAFSCRGIQITDEDFEDQRVDRLRARYEQARDDLHRKRGSAGR